MRTEWTMLIAVAFAATVLLNVYFGRRASLYAQQYFTVLFAFFLVVPGVLWATESSYLIGDTHLDRNLRTALFGLVGGWLARVMIMLHDLQSDPAKVGTVAVIVIRLLLSSYAGLVATLTASLYVGFSNVSNETSVFAGVAGGTLGVAVLNYVVAIFDAVLKRLRVLPSDH